MSQTAKIRRNSVFALLSNITRLLTNILIFIVIARLYGPESLGQFTTAQTFATLFLIFADFGFDTLLATEVAGDRTRGPRFANRYLSLKIITAGCSSAAMFLVPVLHPMSEVTTVLTFVFALYVFLTSMQSFFFSLFKGFEELEHETRISFISNFLALVLLVVLGLSNLPLIAFAVLLVVTRLLGLVLALRVASSMLTAHWFHFSFEGWNEMWKKVLVFGTHTLFGILYFQIDTILLSYWKGDHEVGIYQSVFRIILVTLIILDVAVSALMSPLTRLHGEDVERWNKVGLMLYKTLFLIALPISMILFVYADQVIGILYGKEQFVEAIEILRIFSLIGFIRFAAEPFGLMLTTGHRQTKRMMISIGAAFLNIALNLYFIPKDGSMGAAKVSLITNIVVAMAYLGLTKPFLGSWVANSATLIPLGITICLSTMLWQVRTIPLWYIGIPSFAISLFLGYWIGYTPSERKALLAFNAAAAPAGDTYH